MRRPDRGAFRIALTDGRLVLAALVGCYFVVLAVLAARGGIAPAWRELGVPAAAQSFLDLRSVTSGWECTRAGVEIIPVNPCDPYGRPANYPSLWMAPAELGLGEGSTVYLGIATALVFLASVLVAVGRLGLWEALVYAAAACSPAVMLGVERGNADLLVFALVVLALALFRRGVSGRALAHGVLVLAAMLKLFPLFALGVLLRQRRSWALAGAGAALLVLAVYGVVNAGEIRAIGASVPQEVPYSYGIGVAVDAAQLAVRRIASAPDALGSPAAGVLAHLVVGMAGLALAALLAWHRRDLRRPSVAEEEPPRARRDLDAFWAGAGIFVATFALFNNYDYRLVFLLLTLPQLLRWTREPRPLMPFAGAALAGVLVSLWLGTSQRLPPGIGELWARAADVLPPEELVNWLLSVYFAAALLLTRPGWLRRDAEYPRPA